MNPDKNVFYPFSGREQHCSWKWYSRLSGQHPPWSSADIQFGMALPQIPSNIVSTLSTNIIIIQITKIISITIIIPHFFFEKSWLGHRHPHGEHYYPHSSERDLLQYIQLQAPFPIMELVFLINGNQFHHWSFFLEKNFQLSLQCSKKN